MKTPVPWHLQLLGSATLSGPGLEGWRLERKMAACLAYLALEGATYRSRLVGLLWPESPESTARNNLSQLLRKLRLSTGADLLGSGDPLVLPPEVVVDAVQLRERYTQGRYGEVGALRGELLAGLTYDDCAELEDWVISERDRLRDWRAAALREEGNRLEAAGLYAEALELARYLLDLDPVSEDTWRRLMRLHYLRGDRPAALRAYQKCVEVLRDEFSSDPLPETAALAREIERGAVRSAVPEPQQRRSLPLSVLRPPSLIGREREWARMEAAWAAGRWIYLRGDPGTGKTRLALDFAVSKGEMAVLSGRPGDAAVPFASTARNARSALARWPEQPIAPWIRRELARLVPELASEGDRLAAPLTSDVDVLRLRQAMQVFFIERLGQLSSLVLDDWQYYDDTSNQDGVYMWFTPPPAEVTGHMPPPIVTYRRGEVAPESEQRVLELCDLGMAEIIDIGPLAQTDLNTLMDDVGVPAIPAVRERLLTYTGGNPLFLLETVKHLIETDQLSAQLPEHLPLPERVWQLIERRLERLSPPALQVARAAAILQRDFDVALVADVLGAPVLGIASLWEELSAAQIVRGNGFWHDLIYEAVAGSTPASLRVLLHRSAARALERAGANPARTAHHWLEAGYPAESIPALYAAEQHARATFQTEDADRFQRLREDVLRRSGAPAPTDPISAPNWSLPPVTGEFYGRDNDLHALRSAVLGHQSVVTLVGPGGVGKTRLAVETARELAADFPGGVAFVPLAGETDPASLLPQVARVLGVTDAGSGLLTALQTVLRGRRILLILDNFEQLLGAAGGLAALLQGAPEVRTLVTSRSPLRITDERLYPVAPLTLPDGAPDDHPAVALFVERVRAMRPDFTLTPENRQSVHGIIRRLDGLPLALELAAPRLRALSPAALLARLDRALPLLSQGARDLPERQRALRATIAWSDGLLPPAERDLYRRLAVFHGGWTLEAAEAIMDTPDQLDVLEALSTLIDHSLVRVLEVPGGEPRYDMLTTIREYALEQLIQDSAHDLARDHHAAFLLNLARRAHAGLASTQQARWVQEVSAEVLNLRAANQWLLERNRLTDAAELGWRVAVYAWISGRMADAQAAALSLLAHPQAQTLSPLSEAQAYGTLGIMRLWLHEREAARDALYRAVTAFRAAGDTSGEVLCNVFLSLALTQLGEMEAAGTLARTTVDTAHQTDSFTLALAYSANGFQAMAQRDPQGIVEWYAHVVALAGPHEDHLNALHGYAVLAFASIMGGQHDQAAAHLDQAQRHAQSIGYLNGMAMILEAHTLSQLQQGDLITGATLYGAAQALREQINTPNWDEGPLPPAQTEAMLAGALGAAEFERLRARGHALDAATALDWAHAHGAKPV
jgi:predicted ATPase/DNA-binding SARP family transcriptional activator